MNNRDWRQPAWPAWRIFCLLLAAALLLAYGGLAERLKAEWSRRVTAIVVDWKDVASLAIEEGVAVDDLYPHLYENGVRGVTVFELTGKDLLAGAAPFAFRPLASVPPALREGVKASPDRAALLADNTEPTLSAALEYMRIRMPGLSARRIGKSTLIVLPFSVEEVADSGLLPDFAALEFARRVRASALYRPASAIGVDGKKVAASLLMLKEKYPEISCVIPAGQVIAGYPDVAPVASALKEAKISVAQVEFVRQIGASQLSSAAKPNVLSLHSLVRDELISRRMSRGQVVERMVRAVHERSIRILLMRPYDLYSAGKTEPFLEDLEHISSSIKARGYAIGWPLPLPMRGASLPGAFSVAAVFTACMWFYLRRYAGSFDDKASPAECAALAAFALALGAAIWKVPFASRLAGGLTSALLATEATIWALDRYKKPFAGLIAGLLIVLSGGLCIAGYYGTTSAMLRLTPFSGVKMTLLLPPLLILAHDFKKRVHPESLPEVLKRPPIWGELLLVSILLGGALLMAVRSDNVAFVPGWEIRFREALERLLWVRPRTKEFMLGYPCVVLYYAFIRRGWAARWREVFRVGSSVAFASAVNTFCHFHTLLPLTVVRVVNGWWLGIAVGFVAVVIIRYVDGPFWRKVGRELLG